MKHLFCCSIFFLQFVASIAVGAALPAEFSSAVQTAEKEGAALFAASKQPSPVDEKLVAEAKSKIPDLCNEFKYEALSVATDGAPVVFLIALPSKPDEIVFGRHFKVAGSSVTPSTKSCFATGTPPPDAVGAFITNLLSPAPNEFHVYLSLKHHVPIFVGTSAGVWSVKEGKIEFVEKR